MPTVVSAARRARRRGVDVVLLDDSDPETVDPGDLDAVLAQVTQALDGAADGRIVARLLPPGRAGIATLLVDTSASARNDVIDSASATGARNDNRPAENSDGPIDV